MSRFRSREGTHRLLNGLRLLLRLNTLRRRVFGLLLILGGLLILQAHGQLQVSPLLSQPLLILQRRQEWSHTVYDGLQLLTGIKMRGPTAAQTGLTT